MQEVPPVTSLYTLFPVRVFAAVGVVLLLARGLYLPASFLMAMLLIFLSCRLWADYGLRRLFLSREAHPLRLFPGDEASFSIRIRNDKRLPVALDLWQSFPKGLAVTPIGNKTKDPSGRRVVFLGKYGEDLVTCRVRGMARGCYEIPPGRMNSKDLLGLFHREKPFGGVTEILVYPALLDMDDRELAQHYLMGDIRSDRPFMPDPTWVSSLRDYTPDTPARRIHWKASARHGKLLAKVLEHTADLRLCITLDGDSFETPRPSMEKALSLAATLAVWADRRKVSFGLVVERLPDRKAGAGFCPRGVGAVPGAAGPGIAGKGTAARSASLRRVLAAGGASHALGDDGRIDPWGKLRRGPDR